MSFRGPFQQSATSASEMGGPMTSQEWNELRSLWPNLELYARSESLRNNVLLFLEQMIKN